MARPSEFQPPSRRPAERCVLSALVIGLWAALWAAQFAGCASRSSDPGPRTGEHSVMRAVGDYDDLDAAVEAAMIRTELAIVQAGPGPDGGRRYELVDAQGRPGELVIRRVGENEFTLHARLGRFGRPSDEDRLNTAVARRLRQLYGVDFAPLSR